MTKENEDILVNVEEVYSKTEQYIHENKKSLAIIIVAIVVIVGGYFAFQNFYLGPQELEAQKEMFMAEKYFETDSLDKAINGDGVNYGFVDIISEYGSTPSGNLAHYYLGICYLKKEMYEEAIEELSSFSSNDILVSSISLGGIGDAYMELGDTENAIRYYKKAAENKANELSSPIYLMKAGLAAEKMGDYKEAVELYETIKKDYPKSSEGQTIEKYITRAESRSEA